MTAIAIGLLIPMLGTMLGAAFVFLTDEGRDVTPLTEVIVRFCHRLCTDDGT